MKCKFLIVCFLIVFVHGIAMNKQKDDEIISGKLVHLDLSDEENFQLNTLYKDTVRFVGLVDIGDYSRIQVTSEGQDYYFLINYSEDEINQFSDSDDIIIYWQVVLNHVIEEPESVYRDIVINKVKKIIKQ